MEEKWIKVYEIEYLSKDLSRIYKNIDNEETVFQSGGNSPFGRCSCNSYPFMC